MLYVNPHYEHEYVNEIMYKNRYCTQNFLEKLVISTIDLKYMRIKNYCLLFV